jgi:hypothetical protein
MTTKIGPGTKYNSRKDVEDAAMPMLMTPVCSGVNNTLAIEWTTTSVVR